MRHKRNIHVIYVSMSGKPFPAWIPFMTAETVENDRKEEEIHVSQYPYRRSYSYMDFFHDGKNSGK
ncbi:MAG: hypothetical protein LBI60_04405 [Bacteroidales bacterium]|nr:hypothetical protein [Bacteroidales bacterium]